MEKKNMKLKKYNKYADKDGGASCTT